MPNIRHGGVQSAAVAFLIIIFSITLFHGTSFSASWSSISTTGGAGISHQTGSLPARYSRHGHHGGDGDDWMLEKRADRGVSAGEESSDASTDVEVDIAKYIEQGTLFQEYLRASTEQVVADLVSKGKLQAGSQLTSQYKEFKELEENGWNSFDDSDALINDFQSHVPFPNALRALHLSDRVKPRGRCERWTYEHTLPWSRNGQEMKPVGRGASFCFVTNPREGCLISTWAFSTDFTIKDRQLTDRMSPPLSHMSDIMFLDWQRACAIHNVEPKSLKHVFLALIRTPESQVAMDEAFMYIGHPLTNGWKDLPEWEDPKSRIALDTEAGRLLLGTVQVKGIMWMLLQHREYFGKKAIKRLSVFKPSSTMSRQPEPNMYIELEDVE